jgi:hypothetical protein
MESTQLLTERVSWMCLSDCSSTPRFRLLSTVQLARDLAAGHRRHFDIRIRDGELRLQVPGQALDDGLDPGEHRGLGRDGGLGLPGDGVGFGASGQGGDAERPGRPRGIQDPGQQLDGVGPLLDDLHARVPALQARHLDEEGPARGLLPAGVELAHHIDAAGAADKKSALFLGVDVQQDLALELVRLHRVGPVHAGLFAGGDEHLNGRVGDVLAVQDGQTAGHGDAVVPAEGGAVRPQDVSLDLQDQRVLGEIVPGPFDLLADHVHVPLEDHGG